MEQRPTDEDELARAAGPGGPGAKRILVVANETVAGQALRERIASQASGYETDVLVVCPSLNTRLRHWFSDVDKAMAVASDRLEESLAALARLGITAEGRIGDSDPVQAIDDAMRTFEADEIIISTHPPGRSNWLEKRVVERARERFGGRITHVIVDLEYERAGSAQPGPGSEAPAALSPRGER